MNRMNMSIDQLLIYVVWNSSYRATTTIDVLIHLPGSWFNNFFTGINQVQLTTYSMRSLRQIFVKFSSACTHPNDFCPPVKKSIILPHNSDRQNDEIAPYAPNPYARLLLLCSHSSVNNGAMFGFDVVCSSRSRPSRCVGGAQKYKINFWKWRPSERDVGQNKDLHLCSHVQMQ